MTELALNTCLSPHHITSGDESAMEEGSHTIGEGWATRVSLGSPGMLLCAWTTGDCESHSLAEMPLHFLDARLVLASLGLNWFCFEDCQICKNKETSRPSLTPITQILELSAFYDASLFLCILFIFLAAVFQNNVGGNSFAIGSSPWSGGLLPFFGWNFPPLSIS